VESGLNDGIATPVVLIALAGALTAEGLVDLAVGLGTGAGFGALGGCLMRIARRRDWTSEDVAGPAVLALALAAYAGTLWCGGNGFVAAFVAGSAFGHFADRGGTKEVFYVEQTAGLLSLLTWLVFGAVAVPIVLERAGWQVLCYAVLSLTVVRMLPVAVALTGTRLPLPTVAFLGWFGPRGLASVIFAVLALEELPGAAGGVVAVIGTTVLLSVVAHGLSAKPLAARYGAAVADPAPARQPPVRGLPGLSAGGS
jgi:NhaP-type Na+/H+ or K+/H+ antiporter